MNVLLDRCYGRDTGSLPQSLTDATR